MRQVLFTAALCALMLCLAENCRAAGRELLAGTVSVKRSHKYGGST